MTQHQTIVDCTVSFEGITLEFVLLLKVAIAYNKMRSDEFAGLLPMIIDHSSMFYVSLNMKQHIALMELSSARVEIMIKE